MQVFAANVVIDAHDTALYESMAAFRCVRMNVTASKFFCRMGHCFMAARIFFAESTVGSKFICDDARTAIHFLSNSTLKARTRYIRNDTAANLALTLYGTKHRSLTGRTSDSTCSL